MENLDYNLTFSPKQQIKACKSCNLRITGFLLNHKLVVLHSFLNHFFTSAKICLISPKVINRFEKSMFETLPNSSTVSSK